MARIVVPFYKLFNIMYTGRQCYSGKLIQNVAGILKIYRFFFIFYTDAHNYCYCLIFCCVLLFFSLTDPMARICIKKTLYKYSDNSSLKQKKKDLNFL